MKKLVVLSLALFSFSAGAEDHPKPPGGTMADKPADGQLPDKPADGQLPDKPAGGTMPEMSFAANGSCSVDGTWLTMQKTKDGQGKQVTATFANGNFTVTTADGKRTSPYTNSNGTLSFTGGSLTKAPKGENACDASKGGSYSALFTADCSAMKLQAVDESCAPRKRVMEGSVYHKNAKAN